MLALCDEAAGADVLGYLLEKRVRSFGALWTPQDEKVGDEDKKWCGT
jgi:hypothetical protein